MTSLIYFEVLCIMILLVKMQCFLCRRKKKSKLVIFDKAVVSDEDAEYVLLLQRRPCSAIADNTCDRPHVKEKLLGEKGKSNAVTFSPAGCSAMKTTDCVLDGRRYGQHFVIAF